MGEAPRPPSRSEQGGSGRQSGFCDRPGSGERERVGGGGLERERVSRGGLERESKWSENKR